MARLYKNDYNLGLLVKPILFHISERLLRHEVPHVAAFLDALADEGGRDFQNRGFQHRDRGIINEVSAIVALAREDQKLIVVEDFLVFAPVLEVLQAVHAADEDELAVGVLFREGSQGVDGIGRCRQVHLYVADKDARIVADGQLHHFQALVIIQQVLFLFQGVLGRHHKPQLVQVGEFDQIVGQHDVPMMDGVERAGIDANLFHDANGARLLGR